MNIVSNYVQFTIYDHTYNDYGRDSNAATGSCAREAVSYLVQSMIIEWAQFYSHARNVVTDMHDCEAAHVRFALPHRVPRVRLATLQGNRIRLIWWAMRSKVLDTCYHAAISPEACRHFYVGYQLQCERFSVLRLLPYLHIYLYTYRLAAFYSP